MVCVAELSSVVLAGGGGGGHKKVIIHVPVYVKHHHHKHTIVKHVHHKSGGGGGGDDHYEVLGYTYGEPKAAPHHGGGRTIFLPCNRSLLTYLTHIVSCATLS